MFALDALTLFGLFAVSAMLLFYAFEDASHWCVFGFAAACAAAACYAFLSGAWLFGLLEAIWTLIALKRWQTRRFSGSAER